jgi:putative heme-binding domain-containing protein
MWTTRLMILALASGALMAQQPGDTARGKLVFEGKGGCTNCHRIQGNGSRFGPDLSEIGARTPEQLQTSILDPDAEIVPANRTFRVVSKDGTTTIGRLLNEDTFTVQMIDRKERLLSFQKADLKAYAFESKSPMPSFKDKLSAQEIADVVAWLGTLKPPPSAGRGGAAVPAAPAPAPRPPVPGTVAHPQ